MVHNSEQHTHIVDLLLRYYEWGEELPPEMRDKGTAYTLGL